MSEKFDPYQTWLDIPPQEQPPDHYRLLGVRRFEKRPRVIAQAAEQRVAALEPHRSGERAAACEKLLAEIAAARVCLLNDKRRSGYDRGLLQSMADEAAEAERPQPLTAEQFLDALAQRDLLEAKLIDNLRQQVRQAPKAIPAATIARHLIDAGHLTQALAKRLLAAGATPSADEPATSKPEATSAGDDDLGLAPVDDDLGFAPLKEDATSAKKVASSTPKQPTPSSKTTQPGSSSQQNKPAPSDRPASLLDEELGDWGGDAAGAMGPLDQLADVSGMDADALAGGSPLAPVKPKRKGLRALFPSKKKAKRTKKANVWDSPLMLVGGGALLIILILLGALLWAVTGQSGDEAFDQAEQEYRAGSYSQAIHKYGLYLERFPSHKSASLARVRIGLARLRQATAAGTTDWSAALETANEVLDEIATEDEVPQAKGELASMLPTIAEGLANAAKEHPSAELVDQAQQALAQIDKHVPPSLRPGTRIADINASLALTVHEIARATEVDKAVAAMQEAVAEGTVEKIQEAYAIRKALLKQYSELASNQKLPEAEKLREAVLAVSQAQKGSVEFVEQPQPPETAEPDSAVSAEVALASTAASVDVSGAEGQVVFAAAEGAVYGLSAADGKVFWRRFVGFGSNGRSLDFPPTAVSLEAGADALLVCPAEQEVLRVAATTGQPRWRLAIGERFDAHPVIAGDRVLVATRSGRLVLVDLASGSSPGYVKLPQSLRVAPQVDARRGLIFQLAEHSNLFVLSLESGECQQVAYLGHEPGSITVPPVILSRYLLICENRYSQDAVLRVLSMEAADDAEPSQDFALMPLQEIRLEGHVDTPPLVMGRRVLVTTDLGYVDIFDLDAASPEKPLREAAKRKVSADEDVVRYPLMQGSQFWIADMQLTKFDFLAAHGRITPEWVVEERSVFLQPPVLIGQTIYSVRRKAGLPGVLVTAVAMDRPDVNWQTQLATPLLDEPSVGPGGDITAVTAAGSVFEVDPARVADRTVAAPPVATIKADSLSQGLAELIQFSGGALAVTGGKGSDRLGIFNPRAEPKQWQWLSLPDRLACPAIAFAGGLLVPTESGPVLLIDPRTGNNRMEPFQPPLQPGIAPGWFRPVVYNAKEALLADRQGMLYRLGARENPALHLAALKSAKSPAPAAAPPALLGGAVFVAETSQELSVYRLPDLERIEQHLLSGAVAWGPQPVADRVMLATDDDHLLCFDGGGKLLWQVPLGDGPLAGRPLAVGTDCLLAFAGGAVIRIDASTGRELARLETGRPLGTGPVAMGTHLLVAGSDGTLYQIPQPE